MSDASARAVRRRIIAVFIAAALAVLAGAAVTPSAGATPGQEEGDDESAAGPERLLVADDLGALAGSSADVVGTLDDMKARVDGELARLAAAEKAVDAAIAALAEADAAIQETQVRIETLTARSDDVVVAAFVNPPLESAFDALEADSVAGSSVKQAVLDMQAEVDATVLAELQAARAEMEDRRAAQEAELAKLESVRAEAEVVLGDLETAVSQQTMFVTQLRAVLAGDASVNPDPAFANQLAASRGELEAKLAELEATDAIADAQRALFEAEQRAIAEGRFLCPVKGEVHFSDTWGAARSGGRTHKGTDMMAATGTPTVAPVSGEVVHKQSSLGGLTWYVYGDDGNTYYGAHLSAYENVGAGWVAVGTVIGYVGDSGNAAGTPHLHFEFHPGGGAPVNPYSRLVAAC